MTLKEMQLAYMSHAARLGDYSKISKCDLGNGYCDAEEAGDEYLRSAYWAACVLRYWYKIYGWIKDSASCKLQQEDFVSWLEHVMWVVFYYRDWRWEYKAVVKDGKFIEWKLDENGNKIPNEHYWKVDPDAFDRTVNFFAAAQRGREYQFLNKDKHKSNVLTVSLDAGQEDNGDYILEQAGAVEAPVSGNIQNIVSIFLHEGRSIEALILDGIACHDAFKETKTSSYHTEIEVDEETGEEVEVKEKVYSYHHAFDARKLVKHLNSINQQFMTTYFSPEYGVPEEVCDEILLKLKKLSNTKLYKYIDKTLINLREDKDLMSCLVRN